ncbi:MAG: IscS subfamily cysteine desulfurase [Anaerolineae bacterium]|jgi:cysteine desulfurase
MRRIYLDYNATTPLDQSVFEAMLAYLREYFGNPSSGHWLGVQAKAAVEQAREQVAALLGADPSEIVFTSGGSESDNWAIRGIVEANGERGDHVITSQIEHPAVLNTCRYLEGQGFQVTYLPVDGYGQVDPDDVSRAITPRTILISVMHANNEVGTIQPIEAIGAMARERGIYLHTDAAQSVGKIRTDVEQFRVDLLTVAGHKLYAPKGVGALYVRRGTRITSLIHGAGHEGGRRAGTENVAGIAGLGQACAIAAETMTETIERLRALRDRLHQGLATRVEGVRLNGHPRQRLPNTLNLSFERLDGNALLASLPEIAASTGSACHAGTTEPSSVLMAMGVPPEIALGAIRFSLGKQNDQQEVDRAVELLVGKVAKLRSPAFQNRR